VSDAPYAQVFVMAAIVATMLLPPAAGIAWVATLVLGVPFPLIVTFGERIGAVAGLAAWWGIFFAAALVYAAVMRKTS
jgi:hypothetical protein